MDGLSDTQASSGDINSLAPNAHGSIPPSVDTVRVLSGESYTHHSALPVVLHDDSKIECVLGVDEAGRGPVLGPMVYGLCYLPLAQHRSLLADTHHFDDSKVLTTAVRSELMNKMCDSGTDLFHNCGWATRVMSARDISSGQLRPNGAYNLNAQAMDATIDLIQDVLNKGVNVTEVYIDTIGPPATYQKKLERIFPTLTITVAKKADSLYPCVSAASVCAKVTRDVALDVLYTTYAATGSGDIAAWGSGYPSDVRCTFWMRSTMDPVFGWGSECRFSWGTAKEMLDVKAAPCPTLWPSLDEPSDNTTLSSFFLNAAEDRSVDESAHPVLRAWFGQPSENVAF